MKELILPDPSESLYDFFEEYMPRGEQGLARFYQIFLDRYPVDQQMNERFILDRLAGEAEQRKAFRESAMGLAKAAFGGCFERLRVLSKAVDPQIIEAEIGIIRASLAEDVETTVKLVWFEDIQDSLVDLAQTSKTMQDYLVGAENGVPKLGLWTVHNIGGIAMAEVEATGDESANLVAARIRNYSDSDPTLMEPAIVLTRRELEDEAAADFLVFEDFWRGVFESTLSRDLNEI